MTAAQKTAKDKFKKAIAYRQKTGVSLKEAFAHIYGKKKIGGSGNSYIYKVYDRDSYGDPINNSFKKVTINASTQSDSKDKLYKKYPSSKYFSELQDSFTKKVGAVKKKASPKKKSAKKAAKKVVRKVVKKKSAPKKKVAKKKLTSQDYDKRYKAKKPGKRTSASGNTYYENRANRSDRGKLLGIGNITIDKYKKVQNDVIALEKALNRNLEQMKQIQYKTPFWKQRFKISNAKLKSYIKELKTHGKELKKLI